MANQERNDDDLNKGGAREGPLRSLNWSYSLGRSFAAEPNAVTRLTHMMIHLTA